MQRSRLLEYGIVSGAAIIATAGLFRSCEPAPPPQEAVRKTFAEHLSHTVRAGQEITILQAGIIIREGVHRRAAPINDGTGVDSVSDWYSRALQVILNPLYLPKSVARSLYPGRWQQEELDWLVWFKDKRSLAGSEDPTCIGIQRDIIPYLSLYQPSRFGRVVGDLTLADIDSLKREVTLLPETRSPRSAMYLDPEGNRTRVMRQI
ncbi:hypothetical protein A2631_01820 [Candidatus Daviesbacteria bacterium RIFCSPHIGHO2_01_FULL_44_29]|uniref:Uncharacterized protein n=1 Tax=Candidatus Daviesbacteria bacterium RIFCSPHIGHO2_02_FULL_43_12 TaxID=1797776 RepID=A0A1F5KJM5_9BACT|nr:MAG: hypothetical protein A2631_01820 [Candidatus Daviesbacteria bacterium RIFCSPHIGHO2_01_FULL_44_29]OGE41137.1 MAG: hypothetical protein A3D25_01215 [Candidatus Daviesbacteria bacterium RIFCSPHIGHO2_02_FULL_43_12]OGE69336.1 MAG: hypothetical protein A3B55_02955 [Candidatus Daviesbacteria bacterium RIFCSPLOWO2_01_FULL_43_15]